MITAAFGFVVALLATLICGYGVYLGKRRQKSGLLSRLLPRRREITPNGSFTGAAYAGLCGCLVGALLCGGAIIADGGSVTLYIPAAVFCLTLFTVGLLEDYLREKRGVKSGLKTPARILYLAFGGSLFAIIYLSLKGDSLISLPFIYGAVRTGAFFCPVVTILTVVCSEGMRLSSQSEGTKPAAALASFAALAATEAFSGDYAALALDLVFAGAAAGMLYWSFEPSYLKGNSAGCYLLAAMMMAAAMVSNENGSVICVFIFPLLLSFMHIAEKIYVKLFKKRLFLRLPCDLHLKEGCMKKEKILIVYFLGSLVFSLTAAASVIYKNYL